MMRAGAGVASICPPGPAPLLKIVWPPDDDQSSLLDLRRLLFNLADGPVSKAMYISTFMSLAVSVVAPSEQ